MENNWNLYKKSEVNNWDDDDNFCNTNKSNKLKWWSIPEPILFRIYWLLPIKDLLNAGVTCKRWFTLSNDELMWKQKFLLHYKVEPTIGLKPGAESWKSEYKRLNWNIPFVQSQRLEAHTHQVLHVSFSHNGEMFATCSKDGYVIVWNSSHPCTEKYSHNMKQFSWKYTQYSQFNQSDTLLLVSGVHFGSPISTSGEIAVFTVDGKDGSRLRCRVVNRPYDIFGAWFSDQYLISGDLHWLAHLLSYSELWLNKANQEIDSEHVPIMNKLYKFYNKNASSVRALMVANCPWLDNLNNPLVEEVKLSNSKQSFDEVLVINETEPTPTTSAGNPLSHAATLRRSQRSATPEYLLNKLQQSASTSTNTITSFGNISNHNDSTIRYLDEYRREYPTEHERNSSGESDDGLDFTDDYDDEMESSVPKYLIFSTGSKTYTPHQIGIKRIRNVTFPKKLDPGPSLKERIAAKKAAERENQLRADPDWWNYDSIAHLFDKVDKVIDLHGHIIGMALSPDNRYLYVNTRPWPKNYVITNALEPPPIAQEIDIHVIDLMTLKRVGNMLRAHKAYTPSTECFFIFLDVCEDYVGSGAEDMHAYLWDRYYGICLAKYRHTDVVNSVAFNSRDSEMLVTTSDDYTIKIWRSRAKAKQFNIESRNHNEAFELKKPFI
ncbi:F-box/WD repeat-containing protein 5 isoform X1 [Bactrocera dorsalis]|uniref:F-box/WD repeat-containing protein 5 n=3 Tax=Bactrocera dorsalis TaxID=27457 RepID=A0A034W2T6_BACDO|nr:F-box/WD repeat-containing protein 5 isoform X1 [Bactrocera dorsalis]XP_029407562.1 F-box/WD repeat-containing protein 5 isoform X1 [Bactrocera dorsalis]